MLDLKSYVEQLNRVELDLLNNYLVNLKFVNNIDEDVLQYSLITIDRNTNVRFQAYLCVVKKVFDYYIKNYVDNSLSKYLFKNIELYTKYSNGYNFSIGKECIESIFDNVSKDDIPKILEAFHNKFLNTEIVVKNGIFQFETSKINSKNTGSVYTNPNISNEICEKAIRNKITTTDTPNNLKLLDFGSGTGRFYFEALKILEVTIHKSKQK